jgi:predicted metal-binding protein
MTIIEVNPIIQEDIRNLCRRPYPGHPKGCPNYGKRSTCPPDAPIYDSLYDLSRPVFAIITEFNLEAHAKRMREIHPDWSEAQLYCVLYWQGGARKNLRSNIAKFLSQHPGYKAETVPEAMGVNVTRTLWNAGIILEWPKHPERIKIARQVALAAIPRKAEKVGGRFF